MDGGDPNDPYSDSFQPSSLKVPELRALLHRHDVRVPSNARKAALMQAYEESIRPNVNELRAARNRDLNIRPDGREVVYMSNGQAVRSPSLTADGDSRLKASPTGKARMRRSVSFAESDQSDNEENMAESSQALNEEIMSPPDTSADVSAFSLDNPFQITRPTPTKKSSTPRRARASESKAKDVALQAMRKRNLAAARHSMPTFRGSKTSSEDDNDVDDSNLDIDNTRSSAVSPLVQKQRRIRQWVDHATTDLLGGSSKGGDEVDEGPREHEEGTVAGLFSLFVALAIMAWWAWYVRDTRTIGFCDTSRNSNAVLEQRALNLASDRLRVSRQENVSLESVLLQARLPDQLRATCVPCPSHARCSGGTLTGCESEEYVLHEPLAAHIPVLRSLLPLSQTSPACNPDEEKLLLAADLADEIENRLRRFKADVYCNRKRARLGPRDEPDWGPEGIYALPLSDVYHDLRTAASKSNALRAHGDDFFRQLWDLAMSDLETSGRAQQRSSRILATRGPVGVGVQCRAALAAGSVWRRSRAWLVSLLGLTLVVQWLRLRVRGTSQARRQAQELTKVCLLRLQTVKRRSVYAVQPGGAGSPATPGGYEPFLSVTQLRDNLLREEDNAVRRKALWSKVSRLTESNTNVRTRQAKVQGEWARVWEWVGPIDDDNDNDDDVGKEMTQRDTPKLSSSQRFKEQRDTPSSAIRDGNGRFGADDVAPERPLLGNEYNVGSGRRPSAEI